MTEIIPPMTFRVQKAASVILAPLFFLCSPYAMKNEIPASIIKTIPRAINAEEDAAIAEGKPGIFSIIFGAVNETTAIASENTVAM